MNKIIRFINQLLAGVKRINETEVKHKGKLHVIGHSLGAHISGIAALELKKRKSEWQVDRITGLDPAGPCFRLVDKSMRLDKEHAEFVDVIYSTGGKGLKLFGPGFSDAIGA